MFDISAISRVTKRHELASVFDFVIDDAPSEFLNQRLSSLLDTLALNDTMSQWHAYCHRFCSGERAR